MLRYRVLVMVVEVSPEVWMGTESFFLFVHSLRTESLALIKIMRKKNCKEQKIEI